MNNSTKYKLDLKEYKKIYNEYYFSLCLFADKYLNDIESSKDLVQDVFVKIWKQEIEFNDSIVVRTYLYKSVRNKSLDYLKSKEYKIKSTLTDNDFTKLASDSYFEKEVMIEEVSRVLNNALNTLPQKCKEIMRLSLSGLGNVQISEELSLSVNTVKAQKRIAYQKLRPLLKEFTLIIALIISK